MISRATSEINSTMCHMIPDVVHIVDIDVMIRKLDKSHGLSLHLLPFAFREIGMDRMMHGRLSDDRAKLFNNFGSDPTPIDGYRQGR